MLGSVKSPQTDNKITTINTSTYWTEPPTTT